MRARVFKALTLGIVLLGATGVALAQNPPATPAITPAPAVAGSVALSPAQVQRGRDLVGSTCSECHGVTLRGALGPALRDETFQSHWRGKTAADLLVMIAGAMPPGAPGVLGAAGNTDVIAFILSVNGFTAVEGTPELTDADLANVAMP